MVLVSAPLGALYEIVWFHCGGEPLEARQWGLSLQAGGWGLSAARVCVIGCMWARICGTGAQTSTISDDTIKKFLENLLSLGRNMSSLTLNPNRRTQSAVQVH